MRTIKSKILKTTNNIMRLTMGVLLGGGIIIIIMSNAYSIRLSVREAVEVASTAVDKSINIYFGVLSEASQNQVFKTKNIDKEKVSNFLEQFTARNSFIGAGFIYPDGTSIDGSDLSDRYYFTETRDKLQPVVSDLMVIEGTNQMVLVFAMPIVYDGEYIGTITSITDATILSEITNSIQIGYSGKAFILDSNGTYIANNDEELVLNQVNIIEEKSSLTKVAEIMITGETGVKMIQRNGATKVVAFAPIPSSNGWSLALEINTVDFIFYALIGVLLLVIASLFISRNSKKKFTKMADEISEPIIKCTDRIRLLAEGDLSTEVPEIDTDDETFILANSTRETVESLKVVIQDVSKNLGEMANKNFDINIEADYIGDFQLIKDSLVNIVGSLNEAFDEIKIATEQVTDGSEQVSATAQSLAEGCEEQSSSIQEFSATISEINTQVQNNAENAMNSNELGLTLVNKVQNSNEEMKKMLSAMDEIEKSSNDIANIIKTIDEIATQTDLLALNAAIESARAGEAGKGFAVVAEEVRVLAGESAEAVKKTAELIDIAISAVDNGKNIANDTANSLIEVVNQVKNVIEIVSNIASASEEQAQSLEEVNYTIDQITNVITSNTEISEESAAASEELMAQAEVLNRIVSQYNLK